MSIDNVERVRSFFEDIYCANDYRQLQSTLAKSDADAAAAKRMDTLKGKTEIFWGVIEATSIEIGKKFLPQLVKALSDDDVFVRWIAARTLGRGPCTVSLLASLIAPGTVLPGV